MPIANPDPNPILSIDSQIANPSQLKETFFVDVLLPLHLPGTYTYRVPFEYNGAIRVGQRVVVQFGSKRLYSAIVRRLHKEVPKYTTKYILSILDIEPIVDERQLRFWEWMAAYYMCYPGDVMAVAIPSAFRLSSDSYIVVHPDFEGDYSELNENEIKILDVLSRKSRIEVSEVSDIIGSFKIVPIIKTMIEKKIVLMDEELKQRYTPRSSTWVQLDEQYKDEASMQKLFNQLESSQRSQKQLLVLMRFIQLSKFGSEMVKKKVLMESKELSMSAFDSLVRKGVLNLVQKDESRLREYESTVDVSTITLSDEQAEKMGLDFEKYRSVSSQ